LAIGRNKRFTYSRFGGVSQAKWAIVCPEKEGQKTPFTGRLRGIIWAVEIAYFCKQTVDIGRNIGGPNRADYLAFFANPTAYSPLRPTREDPAYHMPR